MLGQNLLTDHAAPAVVLYSATDALQAVGWFLMGRTALAPELLARDARAVTKIRRAQRDACFAFAFYTTCAVVAIWLPFTIAMVITVTWIVWLVYGINLKTE